MIDVGGGAEPQLCAVLATTVHHREVILARLQQRVLLLLGELGNAADENFDFLMLIPLLGRGDLGALLILEAVAEAGLDDEARLAIEDAQIAVDLKR